MGLGVGLIVGVLMVDSWLIGPKAVRIVGFLCILFVAGVFHWLAMQRWWPPARTWAYAIVWGLTLVVAINWGAKAEDLIKEITPEWMPKIAPKWTFLIFWAQFFFAGSLLGLFGYVHRQHQELVDPFQDERHQNDPNFHIGLAPNYPIRWYAAWLVQMKEFLNNARGKKGDYIVRPTNGKLGKDEVPVPAIKRSTASEQEKRHSLYQYCAGVLLGGKILSRAGAQSHGWQVPAYQEFYQWLTTMPSEDEPYAIADGRGGLNLTESGIELFLDLGSEAVTDLRDRWAEKQQDADVSPSPEDIDQMLDEWQDEHPPTPEDEE